jgi:C4-dicarboxylate transporter, DctM subunit
MSPFEIGILGTGLMIVLFFVGVPVAFSMGVIGFLGFSYLTSLTSGFSMVGITVVSNFSYYTVAVIPMFVLMGSIAFAAGITARLYDASYSLFGRTRGGIAFSTILACAGFSAICGSTSATAAAMGKVALPEMKRYGYDDSLATGCAAAGGTLGIMIPPSNIFIVYGILTQLSIGKLFIAGVLPGVVLTGLYLAAILFVVWRHPSYAPAGPATSLRQKFVGLTGVLETLILFGLVIGGMFAGWFTASQAGAAGAGGVLLIALVRRKITWNGFVDALKDTVLVTCMVMVLIAMAGVFGTFMTMTKIPFMLSHWVTSLPVPPIVIMGVMLILYFIGGCFFDSFAEIVLTVPIVYPTVIALGFDPIWFGVIIVLVAEMGILTPPVGLNVFVIKGLAPDVPIGTIFRGVTPYVIALLVCTIILLIFPGIATFLPSHMTY